MQEQDLTRLNLAVTKANGVSYGCFYKGSEVINGTKYYYKCSNFYSGLPAFGDESFYEVICSRLFEKLGLVHTKYTLIRAKVRIHNTVLTTYLCKSADFSKGFVSRMTLGDFILARGCTAMDVIKGLNLQNRLNQMLVADFLTIQRDRHENNIELLCKKDGTLHLAPLFDNGLSFLAPFPACYANSSYPRVETFDPMYNAVVNNYIGERSLFLNLSLISQPVAVHKLCIADLSNLFYGMTTSLPDLYINKIKEIIWKRYNYLKSGGFIIET